jgi:hydroxyethylthiazole kinase
MLSNQQGGPSVPAANPNADSPRARRMITPGTLAATLAAVRQRRPLVHNLTSAVVANFTANALLALGAAPAMVESPEEVAAFAASADALVVNLGMLTPARAAVMRTAIAAAAAAGKPWALDPVGAGAIAERAAFAQEICRLRPTAIRCNASELLGLAGDVGGGRGVDSGASSDTAITAALRLADATGAVVAVTGAVDYVTDGTRTIALHNGHEMMTSVTGMGCAATAIVGACLAVADDALAGVAEALAITSIAGEMAARIAHGPGSLQMEYLDALFAPNHALLRADTRIGPPA